MSLNRYLKSHTLQFHSVYQSDMQASGKKACFQFPKRSLSYAKIMQASGKKACFQFPERSLSYAKLRKNPETATAARKIVSNEAQSRQKCSHGKPSPDQNAGKCPPKRHKKATGRKKRAKNLAVSEKHATFAPAYDK